jgi:hypothetical protein
MTRPRLLSSCALLLGTALLLAGCETVRENTNCPTIPPLSAEERPKPPVMEEEQIWQPGHWERAGDNYLWREGRWIKREGRSNLWQHGNWVRDRTVGPCRWVPAHWVQ